MWKTLGVVIGIVLSNKLVRSLEKKLKEKYS
jgi:hypothetical protein